MALVEVVVGLQLRRHGQGVHVPQLGKEDFLVRRVPVDDALEEDQERPGEEMQTPLRLNLKRRCAKAALEGDVRVLPVTQKKQKQKTSFEQKKAQLLVFVAAYEG